MKATVLSIISYSFRYMSSPIAWPIAPRLIAHRGAPAYRLEHTLESYNLAISQGAEIIEPDLVLSKDGVFIVRHENEIGSTTNVASLEQFKEKKTTKTIDGSSITGWFTEDFTVEELMVLNTRERIPEIRPNNTHFVGKICTFQQVIDLSKQKTIETGRVIGLYPELKHSTHFRSIHMPMERKLIDVLEENCLNYKNSPVFIQSFEPSCLQELRHLTPLKLVQLVEPSGHNVVGANEDETMTPNTKSDDLITFKGLQKIKTYADVVGCHKEWVIPRLPNNTLGAPLSLVAEAHSLGLMVHIWTLRHENYFLPEELKKDGVYGIGEEEILQYLRAGVDGFFTDAPDVGKTAIDSFVSKE